MNHITLTHELIEAGRSANMGWSHEQVRLLGEDIKKKGWKKRLAGVNIPEASYKRFLALKNAHLSEKMRIANNEQQVSLF